METLLLILLVIAIYILIIRAGSSGNRRRQKLSRITYFEVSSGGSHREEERLSRETGAQPEKLWIPADQGVTVGPYEIPSGLIYVGKKFAGRYGNADSCLINPDLRIDSSKPDRAGSSMSYWPAYASITTECRAAYLEWLAKGRRIPGTNIGYVFLFFYGLERRLLVDTSASNKAGSDVSAIVEEVERLLSIYGGNSSFSNYASSFLTYVRLLFYPDSLNLRPENLRRSWEFPLELKLALANFAQKQEPLPAEWALRWAELDPQHWYRTPAHRCRKEFGDLFSLRYSAKFGAGPILKTRKQKIKVSYRAASSGLGEFEKQLEKPDVTGVAQPLLEFHEIAESCINELDSYSRFIGRKPEEGKSLTAVSLLPEELITMVNNNGVTAIKNLVKGTAGISPQRLIVRSKDLLTHFGLQDKERLLRTDIAPIFELMGKLGYSVVPDIRIDEGKLDPKGTVLLLKDRLDVKNFSTARYRLAVMIVNLALSVTLADDTISQDEKELLESHIETMLMLSKTEGERIRAYVEWMVQANYDFSGLKKKFSELQPSQRETVATFVVRIANADKVIHPQEIKALERVYKILGLDTERIYSDIHKVQTSEDESLTMFVGPKPKKSGFKIPVRKKERSGGVSINDEIVARTLEDTKEVQSILAQVFEGEEQVSGNGDEAIAGLDLQHSNLWRELQKKGTWNVGDYESLCKKSGILPEGAIETINECFYEKVNDVVIEVGDELVINQKLAKELEK